MNPQGTMDITKGVSKMTVLEVNFMWQAVAAMTVRLAVTHMQKIVEDGDENTRGGGAVVEGGTDRNELDEVAHGTEEDIDEDKVGGEG